jgi:hypothetical protein
MRLEIASNKAVKYACLNFHYAKVIPTYTIAFSVFNAKHEWCGCVLFGGGASVNMPKKLGLNSGQYLELNRMALNGKQESTSKVLSTAIRLVAKKSPTCKLLFSYADKGQNHFGTIYQATNWYYIEDIESSGTEYYFKGEWRHDRGRYGWGVDFKQLPKRKKAGKHKYVYPLDKNLIPLCKSLSKPYPKNAQEVNKDKHNATCIEIGGSNPTLAL